MEASSLLIPGAPLDGLFEPPALAMRRHREAAAEDGEQQPLLVAVERDGGRVSRGSIAVLPPGHPDFAAARHLIERWVKVLLWVSGGRRIHLGAAGSGARAVADAIVHAYAVGGDRAFDAAFFADLYGAPFEVRVVDPGDVPEENEPADNVGGHTDGCRIGFDLGASDYKVAAVIDGEPVFSAEYPWNPTAEADPEYHTGHIRRAISVASEHLPRVDAIGGSAAGIWIDNRPRVASLFRAVPQEAFVEHIAPLFERLADEHGVPLRVVNDGEVTALAGSLALDRGAVLGIAMGSSEAGGYVDRRRRLCGGLDELAFCPVDLQRGAPADEWSGDRGVGAAYFSQQAVARLAAVTGIGSSASGDGDGACQDPRSGRPSAARLLERVQQGLEEGRHGPRRIFVTLGAYLGFTVPWYREFYDFDTVLLLGRVVSGGGGELVARRASAVLEEHFPELASEVELVVPDERTRRVGQAVAAASLPAIRAAGR